MEFYLPGCLWRLFTTVTFDTFLLFNPLVDDFIPVIPSDTYPFSVSVL